MLLKKSDPFRVSAMTRDASGQGMTSRGCVLLIFATILLTCVPVIASDYGYADDFWFLSIRPLNAETLMKNAHSFINEGRALFPFWALGVMGQANGVQDLRFVRFISLFGLFFSSVVFCSVVQTRTRANSAAEHQ